VFVSQSPPCTVWQPVADASLAALWGVTVATGTKEKSDIDRGPALALVSGPFLGAMVYGLYRRNVCLGSVAAAEAQRLAAHEEARKSEAYGEKVRAEEKAAHRARVERLKSESPLVSFDLLIGNAHLESIFDVTVRLPYTDETTVEQVGGRFLRGEVFSTMVKARPGHDVNISLRVRSLGRVETVEFAGIFPGEGRALKLLLRWDPATALLDLRGTWAPKLGDQ
jgi:hypothetical protein